MARDKDFETRRKEREEEDRKDQALQDRKTGQMTRPASAVDEFSDLAARVTPLIEQVNNLYNQYIAGVESKPPLERRKQLDQLMTSLQGTMKGTPANQFRYNTLNTSYLTSRDRWDRMLRDLESGKIKRHAGPNRGK